MGLVAWAIGSLVACGLSSNHTASAPVVPPTPAPPLPEVAIDIGAPVARVGDKGVIGSREFLDAASRKVREQGGDLSPEERRALVQDLATEEALWQEAAAEGLYRDPKVRKTMVSLLMREQVYGKIHATDFPEEDLRAYFDAHRDEFDVPEKVEVKRVFVAIDEHRTEADALARAREVREKIVATPGDFKDIAAEYSDDTWKRRGGELGYLARGSDVGVDPAVIDKAFELQIGEVSQPFLAGGGYNVVLAGAHREAVQRTFEQSKGTVLRTIKNDKSKEMLDAYVASVVARYPVVVDDSLLDSLDLTNLPRVPSEAVDEEVPPDADHPGGRE